MYLLHGLPILCEPDVAPLARLCDRVLDLRSNPGVSVDLVDVTADLTNQSTIHKVI